MADLRIEIFSPDAKYNFSAFDCGDESLNIFLSEHMARQHGNGILRAYVLITTDSQPRIIGYYTLSGSCFEKVRLPSGSRKRKVPYANVPSVTLGRLAVDRHLQRQGYGGLLVTHAMSVTWRASLTVGVHGFFVEALNLKVRRFYQNLGFISLAGANANSLFYPTASMARLFLESEA